MKTTHNISISVFVKEFDDEEKTANTLVALLPENFEEEKIKIEEEEIKVQEGTDFKVFKVKTDKERHNKQIIIKLKEILGEEQCKIVSNDTSRIDEEGNFYIRLDKKTLEDESEALVVDHGDCYHIKIVLAAFPKNKKRSIEVAKILFE